MAEKKGKKGNKVLPILYRSRTPSLTSPAHVFFKRGQSRFPHPNGMEILSGLTLGFSPIQQPLLLVGFPPIPPGHLSYFSSQGVQEALLEGMSLALSRTNTNPALSMAVPPRGRGGAVMACPLTNWQNRPSRPLGASRDSFLTDGLLPFFRSQTAVLLFHP